MYCGSCLHDNQLAAALIHLGVDTCLIPMYTPIRTDTPDVSLDQVFFGGINVYLQQKSRLAGMLPGFVKRWLDHPAFLRWVTSRTMSTDASQLGDLTLSMLEGTDGRQHLEVAKLCDWLAQSLNPSMIVFSNVLISGCIPAIRQRLNVPILVTLQGDDVFLSGLPDKDQAAAIAQIQKNAQSIDGFITHSEYYRDHMAEYLDLPLEKFRIVPLGVAVEDFRPKRESAAGATSATSHATGAATVGYLAKLVPEKGLHLIIDAAAKLREIPDLANTRLAVAGWSGGDDADYARREIERATKLLGPEGFIHHGEVTRQEKIDFLHAADILSVPSPYKDPKGLYAIEAMASGTPVVLPDHGAFPELIERTGGGKLFAADGIESLVETLAELIRDNQLRTQLGNAGLAAVNEKHSAEVAAKATWNVYRQFLGESKQ